MATEPKTSEEIMALGQHNTIRFLAEAVVRLSGMVDELQNRTAALELYRDAAMEREDLLDTIRARKEDEEKPEGDLFR